MFGSKQAHDAQHHAAAAWNELVEALGSTRDTATERAKGLSGEASRRAIAAWDVLAGRPQRSSVWPVAGALAAGLAAGWIASEIARRRRPEIDRAVSAVSSELKHAKQNLDDRIARAKSVQGSPVEKAKAAVNSDLS